MRIINKKIYDSEGPNGNAGGIKRDRFVGSIPTESDGLYPTGPNGHGDKPGPIA